ncbi:hypothetical protein CR513_19315, partial [Mucuna pruriens]
MEGNTYRMKMHLPVFAAQKPESMFDKECDFEHEQVCDFIRLFVDDNVYNHIASEIHAVTLWEKIESLYASKCGNNKLFMLNFIGLLLLNSLLESWETFKVSITNSSPNDVVSLQMVKSSVLNDEMKRKTQCSSS